MRAARVVVALGAHALEPRARGVPRRARGVELHATGDERLARAVHVVRRRGAEQLGVEVLVAARLPSPPRAAPSSARGTTPVPSVAPSPRSTTPSSARGMTLRGRTTRRRARAARRCPERVGRVRRDAAVERRAIATASGAVAPASGAVKRVRHDADAERRAVAAAHDAIASAAERRAPSGVWPGRRAARGSAAQRRTAQPATGRQNSPMCMARERSQPALTPIASTCSKCL